MDDGSTSGMSSQPPKDFLALSHGHEWVNFYESFDKLVQDHLSRSSELLRKAMSLPEVADREVAQIRDDLEGQLTTERQQHQATLVSLKQEISSSQQQMSALTQMVGSLMANLERLTGSVDSALAQAVQAEAEARLKSTTTGYLKESVDNADQGTDASETVAVAPNEETSGEESSAPDWSELTVEAEGDPDDEIDLSALAAMEEGPVDETADAKSSDEEPSMNGSERVRPHWLSMARSGSGE
jgi:hypothetical protein